MNSRKTLNYKVREPSIFMGVFHIYGTIPG
jgi:hypothetical protein